MDPLVVLEVDGVAEGFGTLLTLERLLPTVDELVHFERDSACKAFSTVTAHKHLLASMREGVAVEVLW